MDIVRTVVFHGPLAEKFGEKFEFAARSVAEVCSALRILVPGFEKFMMNSKDNGLEFAVMVDGENYAESQLFNPVGGAKEIHFIPVISGAKKKGVLQTILGVVLIVVGVVVNYLTGGTAGNQFIRMGTSMVVGGVVQMLSPTPKTNKGDRKDDPTSYVFNGAVNVQAQGASVPVAYGLNIVGSVVVSAGINADDGYVIPGRDPGVYGDVYRGGGSMMGEVIARAYNEAE